MKKNTIVILVASILYIFLMSYTFSLIKEVQKQNTDLEEQRGIIEDQRNKLKTKNDSLSVLNEAYNELQDELRSSIDTISQFISNTKNVQATSQLPDFIKTQLNSKYIVTMYTLNTDESQRSDLVLKLRNKGFSVTPGYDYDTKPSWMAVEPTVFYYDKASSNKAAEIAALLSSDQAQFSTSRGAGLGVVKGQEHLTFFIHYLSKED